jgi:hypothetical protein
MLIFLLLSTCKKKKSCFGPFSANNMALHKGHDQGNSSIHRTRTTNCRCYHHYSTGTSFLSVVPPSILKYHANKHLYQMCLLTLSGIFDYLGYLTGVLCISSDWRSLPSNISLGFYVCASSPDDDNLSHHDRSSVQQIHSCEYLCFLHCIRLLDLIFCVSMVLASKLHLQLCIYNSR